MGYSNEIYIKAREELNRRRQSAFDEQERRKAELYKKQPKAREIERELAQTAINSAKAVLAGGDVKAEIKKQSELSMELQNDLKTILKNEGLPEDYLDEKFTCSKCDDRGNVDGKMCECMKKLLMDLACKQLNDLTPLAGKGFENFDLSFYSDTQNESGANPRKRMESILSICRNYAENFTKDAVSLLMQGETGLGKTHLALAIAEEVTKQGYSVIYGSVPNIVSNLEKEQFGKSTNTINVAEKLLECDLLILDDLGTEFRTTFTISSIYNIFNQRIIMGKPVIISTNLTAKELEDVYSQRLLSRIVGYCKLLPFVGEDIRIKSRMKNSTVSTINNEVRD